MSLTLQLEKKSDTTVFSTRYIMLQCSYVDYGRPCSCPAAQYRVTPFPVKRRRFGSAAEFASLRGYEVFLCDF